MYKLFKVELNTLELDVYKCLQMRYINIKNIIPRNAAEVLILKIP